MFFYSNADGNQIASNKEIDNILLNYSTFCHLKDKNTARTIKITTYTVRLGQLPRSNLGLSVLLRATMVGVQV